MELAVLCGCECAHNICMVCLELTSQFAERKKSPTCFGKCNVGRYFISTRLKYKLIKLQSILRRWKVSHRNSKKCLSGIKQLENVFKDKKKD